MLALLKVVIHVFLLLDNISVLVIIVCNATNVSMSTLS